MFKLIVKLGLLTLAALAAGVLWQKTKLTALALSRIDPVPETRALPNTRRDQQKWPTRATSFQLIARFLAQLPDWLLAQFAALGMAVWVPWQWMRKFSGIIQRTSYSTDHA